MYLENEKQRRTEKVKRIKINEMDNEYKGT